MSKGAGKRVLAALICLAGGIALLAAAAFIPGFAQWYATVVYPLYVGSVGRLTGIFPFSVVEFLLYGLLLGMTVSIIYTVIKVIRERRLARPLGTWFSWMFLAGGILFVWYGAGCGVNYHRTSFSREAGIYAVPYDTGELEAVCAWLSGEVNRRSALVARDENGIMVLEGGAADAAVDAMSALGETFSGLSGTYPRPKPVTVSEILSCQGLSGIYSPFTAEANYNADMTPYNIPFTLCHELSHLKGYMEEQEANFIAFLASIGSERMDFQYSGYLMGWIYCTNALYELEPEEYLNILSGMNDDVLADLRDNSAFWASYDGSISRMSDWMNDTYLKANGQADGIASYNKMVDLIISYCRDIY